MYFVCREPPHRRNLKQIWPLHCHLYFLSTRFGAAEHDAHIFRASWAWLHICGDWQPDALPSARPQPRRQVPQAMTGISPAALHCLPSELRAICLYGCLCASLTDAPSAQMWVVWGRRGGWQNTAKSLCNQRVWLGGGGDSAGMQTFTIGQAVLVNRSGCTKEAGWIIDRV